MKRKIIATLMALATASCCALGFTACGDEPENPPEKEPEQTTQPEIPSDDNGKQLTAEEWKKEINNIKGLGDYKNYTVEVKWGTEGEIIESYTRYNYIDYENLRFYCPENYNFHYYTNTVYFEAYNSYYCDEYIDLFDTYLYDCKGLFCTEEDDLVFKNYFKNNTSPNYQWLDYYSVYGILLFESGLAMLQNFKDDEIVDLEESYDLFTFNDETHSYTAKNVAIATANDLNWWREKNIEGYYTKIEYYNYNPYNNSHDLEITFKQNSVKIKTSYNLYFDENSYINLYNEITIYNINSTEIKLSEEHLQALTEAQK